MLYILASFVLLPLAIVGVVLRTLRLDLHESNSIRLTLRGKIVLAVFLYILSVIVIQFAFHFNVDCDLRPNMLHTPCYVWWE